MMSPFRTATAAPLERALLVVAALSYICLLIAAAEAFRVHAPRELASWGGLEWVGLSISDQLSTFGVFLAPITLLAAAIFGREVTPRFTKWWALAACTAAAVTAARGYEILMQYRRFQGRPILLWAWCGVGAYLACSYVSILLRERVHRAVRMGWVALGCVLIVATHVVNLFAYRDAYPVFHSAVLAVTFLVAHATSVQALTWLDRPRMSLVAALVATALAAVSIQVVPKAEATPYYYSSTILGQTATRPRAAEPSCVRLPRATAEQAEALFREYSGLPALPSSFHLDDYNVLLILIESLRFSDTSLGYETQTTPALLRLAEKNGPAFSFERAFSPSSLTLASVASILSMTYPSHAKLTVGHRMWTGELRREANTVAEHFAAEGYSTFRLVHEFQEDVFRKFDQGFQESHVEPSVPGSPHSQWHGDVAIAERTVSALRARSTGRFFGLVFFGSPHDPYTSPNGAATKHERYLAELTHADNQVDRILRTLDDLQLLEQTVVIITSDHGEEFGEHAGTNHGRTLYRESLHVPLVVRIPGTPGRLVSEPTSLSYLFPWLFGTARGRLRSHAEDILTGHIAPMMEATQGAVVAELVGSERMRVALIYRDTKAIYDFLSEKYELYALDSDPLETTDLIFGDPSILSMWTPRMDSYRRIRSCSHNLLFECHLAAPSSSCLRGENSVSSREHSRF